MLQLGVSYYMIQYTLTIYMYALYKNHKYEAGFGAWVQAVSINTCMVGVHVYGCTVPYCRHFQSSELAAGVWEEETPGMPNGRGCGSSPSFGAICTCIYMYVARCTAEGTG